MMAAELYTPVDLRCFFQPEDLEGTGVELDTHITLIYAQGKHIPRKQLLKDIETILGGEEYANLMEYIQTKENYQNVLDLCEISFFENDRDFLILKLKPDTQLYNWCEKINGGLRSKYDIKSDFDSYNPHLTLAELKPGKVEKYLGIHALENVIRDSKVQFEDLFISYGTVQEDRKQYWLTQYKNVDRYFRLERLKKEVFE